MSHTTGTYEHTPGHGHVPVMVERITELFAPAVDSWPTTPVIVDCTLGAGGHSEYLLTTFPNVTVIGVDRDATALAGARERLVPFGDRFVGMHTRFDGFLTAAHDLDHPAADAIIAGEVAGVLFDLGVSSMQLDQPERGFAYSKDAPLDMRMDTSETVTAADIVNGYSHGELARVLKTYGDERFAGRIASAICDARRDHPIATTSELVELIYQAVPAPARRSGGHPAKRSFQALRVAVNAELESIARAVPAALDSVGCGGRVVVMSYQSQEDKLVKKIFAEATASKTPVGLPVDLPDSAASFTLVTRGSEKASPKEIESNSRAKSVRVRAVERTQKKSKPT